MKSIEIISKVMVSFTHPLLVLLVWRNICSGTMGGISPHIPHRIVRITMIAELARYCECK